MTEVLLDTHIWAWILTGERNLSPAAESAVRQAKAVFISAVSIYEIGQKVRIGKWPVMERFVAHLPNKILEDGGRIAELTPEICLTAAMLNWTHRDPFDRMLAATALHYRLTLISADTAFDGLDSASERVTRVW